MLLNHTIHFMLKFGILREGKVPPDARVPLSPQQCRQVIDLFPVKLVVQPSPIRCFTDAEYKAYHIDLQEDLSSCDVLLGVKEVPIDLLIPDKTYLFFSHTIKQQPSNRKLLQAILAKHIRMIDYETLTDPTGNRLIAFGFYAGIVGSHNGLWTYGQRTGLFNLPRLCESHEYATVMKIYGQTKWPPMRIVLTGSGRVAAGAIRNLQDMGFQQVSPSDFLHRDFQTPVFTQLFAKDYVQHRDEHFGPFNKAHFYQHSEEYISTFAPYYRRADIFMNCIFYNKKAPRFFETADMLQPDFRIQVIADISCDLMPDSSVPATIKASTIADPVFGFDPATQTETPPFQAGSVDVMSIDNLPSELPRDAAVFFGKQLIDIILPEILQEESTVIRRATIAEKGHLTERYGYLADYVGGTGMN